jgi:hypothetical protein
MDPQAVSGLQIGYFRNRAGRAIALDADVNLRTNQVEGRVFGKCVAHEYCGDQQESHGNGETRASGIRDAEQRAAPNL